MSSLTKVSKIFLSTFTLLSLFSCIHKKNISKHKSYNAPEVSKVSENGSRPEGFYNTIKSANLNIDEIKCNSQNRYGTFLKPYSEKSANDLKLKLGKKLKDGNTKKVNDIIEDHLMWAMVRAIIIDGNNNNLGAFQLKGHFWEDENGKKQPLTIFRTGFTPNPSNDNSCYKSLLKSGKVKHVINLYDGDLDISSLVKEERKTAKKSGATYVRTPDLDYGDWRRTIRKNPDKPEVINKAAKDLSRLIKEQILMPKGKKPKGNIVIHCGGGMHRTGIISGILQRAINNDSKDIIESAYKYHTGYKDNEKIAGFEQGNLDFIYNFDPNLLKK